MLFRAIRKRELLQGCEIGGVLPTSSLRPGPSAANLILGRAYLPHKHSDLHLSYYPITTIYLLTTTLHNRAVICYTYTKHLDKSQHLDSLCIAHIPCASRALRQLPRSRTLLLPRHRQSQVVSLAKAVLVSVSPYDMRIYYPHNSTARLSLILGLPCVSRQPAIRLPASAPENTLKL